MNILLIKPYMISDSITPPLGLGYLAAAVGYAHQVRILDCFNEGVKTYRLKKIIEEEKPDCVGIQSYSMDIEVVREYLRIIKRIDRSIWTIIGGPHPSSVPEEAMNYFGQVLDFGFIGEAERGFSELVNILSDICYPDTEDNLLKMIPGLIWRKKDGRIICNKISHLYNIDEIALPRWDLLLPDSYPPAPHAAFMKKFPVASIIVSRGCPFDCIFCAAHLISGKKIRYRSVENVITEIIQLHQVYGINEIHIIDDNFTLKRDYVIKFCHTLKRSNISIPWTCPNGVRLDTLDSELLLEMKTAGCYSVSVGIESGSQRILDLIKKNITLDMIKEKIILIKEAGLEVTGFFIIGFPTETAEEINDTIDFSLELDLNKAQYMNFYPLPGTQVFDMLEKKETPEKIYIRTDSFAGISYCPDGLSKRRLKWFQRKAFLYFYCRPKYLLHIIKQVRSCRHLWFIITRIYRYMATS